MIIVKLMGGLGNQMFQYALGRRLSLRYSQPLKLDLSFLRDMNRDEFFVMRDYDLDAFNINAQILDTSDEVGQCVILKENGNCDFIPTFS